MVFLINYYSLFKTSTFTWINPLSSPFKIFMAFLDKSIILPSINGPLSFTLTITEMSFLVLVTFTLLPNGKVLCAAVRESGW